MAYGLRVRDASGNVILDTSDKITRKAYISSQTSSSGNSGAQSILNGKSSAEFGIIVNLVDAKDAAHKVYRSSDTIYWEAIAGGGYLNPATCIMFSFIYD